MVRYRIDFKVDADDLSKVCYGDTDSVFMILKTASYKKFINLSDTVDISNEESLKRLEALKTQVIKECFDIGKILAEDITRNLFKNPINLEFEKVYHPIILFSKKRYIGNYYGTSPDTVDFVEKKGIVLKRRDNPNIVKKLYTQFINPVLKYGKPGVNESVKQLENEIITILNNKVNFNDLVITKSLSKSYGKERCELCEKSATRKITRPICEKCCKDTDNILKTDNYNCKCFKCYKSAIKKIEVFYCKKHSENMENCQVISSVYSTENSPHIALCKKISQRDKGATPVVGDRISYVFIDDGNPKTKLFERAEDPQYVIDNKLKIDYNYYINNQLKKPISEILQFLIPNHETFFDDIMEKYNSSSNTPKKKQMKMTNFLAFKGKNSWLDL